MLSNVQGPGKRALKDKVSWVTRLRKILLSSKRPTLLSRFQARRAYHSLSRISVKQSSHRNQLTVALRQTTTSPRTLPRTQTSTTLVTKATQSASMQQMVDIAICNPLARENKQAPLPVTTSLIDRARQPWLLRVQIIVNLLVVVNKTTQEVLTRSLKTHKAREQAIYSNQIMNRLRKKKLNLKIIIKICK